MSWGWSPLDPIPLSTTLTMWAFEDSKLQGFVHSSHSIMEEHSTHVPLCGGLISLETRLMKILVCGWSVQPAAPTMHLSTTLYMLIQSIAQLTLFLSMADNFFITTLTFTTHMTVSVHSTLISMLIIMLSSLHHRHLHLYLLI
jgi:hypothetical protein